MKKRLAVVLLVLCLSVCANAVSEEALSGLDWIFRTYYGFSLPETCIEDIRQDTDVVDVGAVRVTFYEALTDGAWVFTSARLDCTDAEVLLMPGSAHYGDCVCGGNGETFSKDQRSYRTVAQEENKRLLAVYVYPAEFDGCDVYFLDHLLLSPDSSLMISGSYCPFEQDALELHWSIQVYEVDVTSGQYTLVETAEAPLTVVPHAQFKALSIDFLDPNMDDE